MPFQQDTVKAEAGEKKDRQKGNTENLILKLNLKNKVKQNKPAASWHNITQGCNASFPLRNLSPKSKKNQKPKKPKPKGLKDTMSL